MSNKKYFTLKEARQVLPLIQEELLRLQKLQNEFQQKVRMLRTLNREERFKLECNLDFLNIQAKLHIRNIAAHDVLLKDIDQGLIDFPAMMDGVEVLYCWKLGEKDIEHYHGVDEGYAGRKKINPE